MSRKTPFEQTEWAVIIVGQLSGREILWGTYSNREAAKHHAALCLQPARVCRVSVREITKKRKKPSGTEGR